MSAAFRWLIGLKMIGIVALVAVPTRLCLKPSVKVTKWAVFQPRGSPAIGSLQRLDVAYNFPHTDVDRASTIGATEAPLEGS